MLTNLTYGAGSLGIQNVHALPPLLLMLSPSTCLCVDPLGLFRGFCCAGPKDPDGAFTPGAHAQTGGGARNGLPLSSVRMFRLFLEFLGSWKTGVSCGRAGKMLLLMLAAVATVSRAQQLCQ